MWVSSILTGYKATMLQLSTCVFAEYVAAALVGVTPPQNCNHILHSAVTVIPPTQLLTASKTIVTGTTEVWIALSVSISTT